MARRSFKQHIQFTKRLALVFWNKSMKCAFATSYRRKGGKVQRQVSFPITYDGIIFEEGLRLDVLVDSLVICELKAVQEMHPVFTAQLMSQLKLTQRRLGYLINFNVPLINQCC